MRASAAGELAVGLNHQNMVARSSMPGTTCCSTIRKEEGTSFSNRVQGQV